MLSVAARGLSRIGLATGAILAFLLPLGAEPGILTGDALVQAVSGTTVAVDTPLGTPLPIVHHADGTLTGTAPGSLGFHLGSPTDRGRWWVANGRLCQKWNRWLDGETNCLQISRDGPKMRWRRDDGRTGTAAILHKSEVAAATAPLPQPSALGGPLPQQATVATSAPAPARPRLAAAPPATAAPAIAAAARTPAPPATAAVATPRPLPGLAAASPAGPVSYRVARVQADDMLNIRTSPSTTAQIVGAIPPTGRGVRMVGNCIQDWCPVAYARTRGWVNRFYLDLEPGRSANSN